MSIYPVEKYIELDNNPYLLGRIALNEVQSQFMAEIDIIYKESHKIFMHVGIIFNQPGHEEAFIMAVQKLREFLEKLENSVISHDP